MGERTDCSIADAAPTAPAAPPARGTDGPYRPDPAEGTDGPVLALCGHTSGAPTSVAGCAAPATASSGS